MISAWIPIISLLAAGAGLGLLGFVLLQYPKKDTATILLMAFVALNSSYFFIQYFIYSGIISLESYLFFTALEFLEGGLFYLYVKAWTSPSFRLRWRHLIHLWPVLLHAMRLGSKDLPFWAEIILPQSYYLILTGYLIAAARLLPDYGRWIRSRFSTIEKIDSDWLYTLVFIYLGCSLFALGLKTAHRFGWESSFFSFIIESPNTWVFFISFYLIAWGHHHQPLSDKLYSRPEEEDSPESSPGDKYADSALTMETCRKIWQRLDSHMQKEEPFLDEALTLHQLAEAIGQSPWWLSQTINRITGQNFYDYVNGCRAEKARRLIENDIKSAQAMIDIGIDAGFASKTTFYKHFKRCFAKTPLQYRKTLFSEK